MDEIRRLYAFNRWATLRFLGAADGLTEEELARDMKSSFPSVLATLTHMYGAEWIWLERWRGRVPDSFPQRDALTSVAAVREHFGALWADQGAFLEALTDADLTRSVGWRSLAGDEYTGRLGDLLRHVVNHATYHRGQLATLVRQLGHTPPPTDLVLYCIQEG